MSQAHAVGPLGRPIRFHEEDYPYWRDHLSADVRTQLVEEDVRAGESVVAEMLIIVATVFMLGIATVLSIWL